MLKTKLTIIFFGLLSFALNLNAQISLAPSFVFIDENSGVGNLYVSNNSDKPYEMTIAFAFGYPDSDAEGSLVMNYNDSIAYTLFALDSMIRAFPRSFILAGGEQRTVRIQVIPNQRRKEGYFYTRMKVLAKPQAPEVTQENNEEIGTRITFNFEQITAVFYRRGEVSTGLKIKKVQVDQVDSTLIVLPHLEKLGNAPFLGQVTALLKDLSGNILAETQNTTTAYFDVIRRLELNIAGVKPGNYRLELTFETRRNDMAAGDLVQAPPMMHTVDVVVR